MGCAIRSTSNVAEGTRTNTTFTAPSGIQNGDRLVIFLMTGANGGLAATPPSGFTALTSFGATFQSQFGADPWRTRLYGWEKVASGESGNYTCTHSNGGSGGIMYAISGAHASTAAATAVTNHAEGTGGANLIAPTITPSANNAAILWIGQSWDAFGAASPPSGTTPTFTEYRNTTTNEGMYSAAGILATAGATGSKTVTSGQGDSRPWLAALVSIEQAAGGQTVTVNQVTETDSPQTLTHLKAKALGQNSETDTAQAMTARKAGLLGQLSETDIAQAIARNPQSRLISAASETDLAQAVTQLKTVTLGQSSETDLAQTFTIRKTLPIGQSTETDAAQTMAHTKAMAIGQTSETDAAQSVTAARIHGLGLNSENDAAQTLTARKAIALGQASETDTPQTVSWAPKIRLLGQATETDAAQLVTVVLVGSAPTCDRGLVSIDISADYLVWDLDRDLTTDYQVWDNRECMDFVSRRNTGNVTYADVTVLRRAPNYKELATSNGAYTATDVVFLCPRTLLGATPKPGDHWLDTDGTTYTVLELAKNAFTSFYRMITRDLVLAYDLRDTIDIQRATVSYDAAGGKVRTFPPVNGSTPYAALAAKAQKITETLTLALGIDGFKGDYAVTIAQDVSLTDNDRVKWGSIYLDIVGVKNPSRIDELPVLDCVLQP